jgi:hypothetical protein
MARMLSFSAQEREQMARAGWTKMELQFDEQIVIDRYPSVLGRVCSKIGCSGI